MVRKYNKEEIVKGVVSFLKDSNQEGAISEVASALTSLTTVDKEKKIAHIFTPIVFSQEDKDQIQKKLEEIAGHEIILKEKADKKLLGGFKVKLGDWVYDASLSGQLESLKNELYDHIE